MTDLHGPDRDAALEAAVKRWIAADPRHAAAFELATEAWISSGELPASLGPFAIPAIAAQEPSRARSSRSFQAAAAAAALLFLLVGGLYWILTRSTLTTSNERKTVVLQDGTQVEMNANTELAVHYDTHARSVALVRGEALFIVTKHRPLPFVVVIGDHEVIATGTSFDVRRERPADTDFAVTLIEGQVMVAPVTAPAPHAPDGATLLAPGERLRVSAGAPARLDQPALAGITAWKSGQLIFEDAALRDAVAEFNRYGGIRLQLKNRAIGDLRVGGVFRAADPSSFAQAIAAEHGLHVSRERERIVLSE